MLAETTDASRAREGAQSPRGPVSPPTRPRNDSDGERPTEIRSRGSHAGTRGFHADASHGGAGTGGRAGLSAAAAAHAEAAGGHDHAVAAAGEAGRAAGQGFAELRGAV